MTARKTLGEFGLYAAPLRPVHKGIRGKTPEQQAFIFALLTNPDATTKQLAKWVDERMRIECPYAVTWYVATTNPDKRENVNKLASRARASVDVRGKPGRKSM